MLTDDCIGCSKSYGLNKDTCMVVRHLYQPWFDYLQVTCPNCDYRTRIFVEQDTADAIEASDKGIFIIVHDFAEDELIDAANRVYGITFPKEQELTPRQELRIQFFRYLLERGDID